MKAPASVVLVLAVCLSTVVPSSAAADKTLSNVRGTVSVDQGPGTASQPVAVNASIAIANNDYAVTGGVVNGVASQGAIQLPDSTQILVGQSTRVQMKAFDQQPNLTTASFIILSGKLRFAVKHPGGAKANYTFQTNTGQIAVRGTEGDIWAPQPGALQVNVYEVTDPNLPVEVTLNNGKVYKLSAGQTLSVGIVGAAIVAGASAGASSSSSSASVTSTSQSTMSNFSEFGAVSNSAAVGAAAASAAAASSGGIPAIAAVAAGVAAVGGVVVGVSGGGKSEPSPSPANVHISVSSLAFTPGTGPQSFTVSQSGFAGAFHASSDQPSVATVNATATAALALTPKSTGTFTVTPKSNGNATITVTGGSGVTSSIPVSVQANKIVVPSSLPTFTTLNQKQNFTATETYYTGGFTAKSSNPAVAKITSPGSSSSSAAGQFTVTSIANGNATIAVSDGLGHTSPVSVTVTATAPSPTPTSIPICIGETTGGRDRDARHHMDPAIVMAPNKLSPAANPTCTPPPARVTNPVVRPPQPQPHPIGPQPPVTMPGRLPGMPTPPPMPGPP
ncbi:MAG TPA: FecR domain-containing protein [Candidatus Baltobacteraceae bacterium]|jgi:hypothetical protein